MATKLKPCKFRVRTEDGKELEMDYDGVRQYLLDNSGLWKGTEGLRTKAKGAKKAAVVKAMPSALSSVEETAKALENFQKGEVTEDIVQKFNKTKKAYYPSNGVKVFHGSNVTSLNRDNDGLIWFTNNKNVAEDYRKRAIVKNEADLSEYDDDSIESGQVIEVIADEQGIDLNKGRVFVGELGIKKPLDLTSPQDDGNISDVEVLWNKLHKYGLTEKWSDLDDDYKDELIDNYQKKATWKLLEEENIYNDAKKKGFDAIVITDVGVDGKPHKSYGVFGVNKFYESSPLAFAEAYHKAKADGTNPELVKAVEELIGQKEKPTETKLSPEQELSKAFQEWKEGEGKMGIIFDPKKQAERDIKFLAAVAKYLKTKLAQGAYSAEQFIKDLIDKGIPDVEKQRADWENFYAQNAPQKKEPTNPPVTPPPPTGTETPEGGEGEVPKTAFMRGFMGATKEEQRNAMEEKGLFRKPGSLDEAKEKANKFVSDYGLEAALEAARNESIDGLYKTYLYGAVLADNLAKQNDPKTSEEEYKRLIVDYANIANEASQTFTTAGQQLRAWQDILAEQVLPFSYEGIKRQWTEKYGEDSWTKEREEQFQKLVDQFNDLSVKYKQLENEKANWEAQDVVDAEAAQEKKQKPVSYLKEKANSLRKLLTTAKRPGIFMSANPASLAWDAAIEGVASVLEAGGNLEIAIKKGVEIIRSTDWYKSLTKAKKDEADNTFDQAIREQYKTKATIDKDGNIQIPPSLLRSYVESGTTNVEDIINDVLSYLKKENDSITERDVRTAIINYGRRNNPTPNQKRDAINRLKREMKLITNLEDIQNKIPLAKNPVVRRELSDREKQLKKAIEEAHIENFGYKPQGKSDAERLTLAKKNAQKAIDDLRNRTPRPERRPPVEYDKEMSNLLDEKFRLREEVNSELAKEEIKRQTTLQKIGKGIMDVLGLSRTFVVGIGDLGTILIQGSILPFRSARVTGEAIKNLGKAFWSEQYYQDHINEIHQSEYYRMMKQSGLDIISPFDKNIKVEETGIDNLGEAIINALFLPLKYIPTVGPKAYEFAKRLNFVRILNRSQSAYMNTLRVGNYILSAQNLESKGITFQNNKEAYKDVADMLNTLTGRTSLGNIENSKAVMTGLNLVFFSAKNWASILKMFTPYVFAHVGKRRAGATGLQLSEAQKVYAYTFLKWVATTSLLTIAIKALTDWNDEDEEEKKRLGNVSVDLENPGSSAFGKIRVGNQVFDPWGGKMQVILLQSRILMHYLGQRPFYEPYTGTEKYLRESPFESPAGLIGKYSAGKLSPLASLLYKYASMTPVKGRPGYFQSVQGGKEISALEPIGEGFTNLTWAALGEVYGQQPLSIDAIATMFIIAGGGLTTLNNQEQASSISRIRDLLNPGEKEASRFMKAFSSYVKDGDTNRAAKVLDRATGVYELVKKEQALREKKAGTAGLKQQIIKARKEAIQELYEGLKNDRVSMGYSIDKKYTDELMETAYTGKKHNPNNQSRATAEAFNAINSIPEDLMVDVRERYDTQYDELMTVSKGLDNLLGLNKAYEIKMKRIPWVKKYERIKGITK